jgi:MFS family permease
VVWVIISFLLTITLLATQVSRLGDMFGRVRMHEAGFAVFVLGSLLCALAWNELSIIVFRVVQGVGGALIMANSGAVIADLYPRERRGRAYGFTALGWTIGAMLGIVLGGLIVTYVSWRWIFWINVPTGVLAIVGALRVLRDKAERTRQRLDPLGMVTLGLGLFGVLWAITKLANAPLDATISTPLWVIVAISLVNGVGTSMFFPANSSAIMKAAPPDMFGIASGMLRTFANIGMVFSFAVAILVASQSISRALAFAIFVGCTSLHGPLAAAFTTGLHAAFYESVGFMVIAAILSALRGAPKKS